MTERQHLRAIAVALLLGWVLAAQVIPSGAAHEGATGIVKERMDAMSAMSEAMKALAGMLRSEGDFNAAGAAEHAATVKRHAAKLPHMFPAGSHGGVSRALPEVWQRHDEFRAGFGALAEKADDLADAASSGDRARTAAAFRAVGEACGDCHNTYRMRRH